MSEVVSVVIPTYNAVKYIERTLDSILQQTYRDLEILVVDDCSTDGTREVIKAYQDQNPEILIHMIELEENQGPAAARNEGIRQASGRYLAFLDADDIWEPEKTYEQLIFMKRYQAAFACTSYEYADEEGIGLGKFAHVPERITYEQAIKNTIIFTSTVLLDLSQLPKDEIQMPEIESEDTATWWKILRGGHVAYGLDQALVRYRRPAISLSSNKIRAIRRVWHLYRSEEQFSIMKSAYCFVHYAVRATLRRL